jgi:hypothetical protein
MKSSLPNLSWRVVLSNPRVGTRLLVFPVLAAFVAGGWISVLQGTSVFLSGNKVRGAVFLVLSALAAGLAGSIVIIPPRRTPRARAAFPVSAGIVLWYCCALISLSQYIIGIPRELLSVWISGPAFLYTFLTSYSAELLIIVLLGASCALFAFVSREFAPNSGIEDLLGYLVWFVCALRALLLACWGPLNGLM